MLDSWVCEASLAYGEQFKSQPPLEYSDDTWALLVNHAVVDTEDTVSVRFNDEAAVPLRIES